MQPFTQKILTNNMYLGFFFFIKNDNIVKARVLHFFIACIYRVKKIVFYVTIYIEKIKSPQEYKHGWSRDQIL